MIVKIKNNKDSWSYFECRILHSRYEPLGEMKDHYGDTVILLKNEDLKKEAVVKFLNLEMAKKHLTKIITDRVCYVLNNCGETIDKI